ncbi:putative regulator of septum formation [Prauserella shujinwangii]|uniref:Putative regulator of septum formation n=1 Tax=Prauserella shujinwangii TaxID=1453103 RepID=A0A2T0LUZ8_9PSEU|nr:septum formation family protein [Prauserella shujinwangii]PRX47627.1 putative regulator of septum formation [Prauserella shujinwangii]
MALSACTTQVPGTAASGTGRAPASVPASASPSATGDPGGSEEPRRELPEPGQCVLGNDLTPIDCGREHTVEITMGGTFGGDLPDRPPDRESVFAAVFPSCREEAARYLGNEAYDATTLGAWLMWASEDDWANGQRWYRCGVAQLSPEGEAVPRTGSAEGVLAGEGLYDYQVCSSVRPSKKLPKRTSCAGPHLGEAIGVVRMGRSTDPLPSADEFDRTARDRCQSALVDYLGVARNDVLASWRWPDESNWRRGFTNLTCYAETEQPVRGTLRDIRSGPLPR